MIVGWPLEGLERCALTIGVFDGVHRGHAAIVSRCRRLAEEEGVAAVAVTFDRRPEEVIDPEGAHPRLSTPARRVELLREAGADRVAVLRFDEDLASMTAEEFASELLDESEVAAIVVGENFRFGRRGAGDADLLARVGVEHEVAVVEEPLLMLDGAVVSSTRIREAMRVGDVVRAARCLGRDPETEGIVIQGEGYGRDLGYPTANLAVVEGLMVPADGVYAGWAEWEGRRAAAAIAIGDKPTFPGSHRSVEAHLIDVSEELLGREMRLRFVRRFRDQRRYPDRASLALAIGQDVAHARRLLELVGRAGGAELPEQYG